MIPGFVTIRPDVERAGQWRVVECFLVVEDRTAFQGVRDYVYETLYSRKKVAETAGILQAEKRGWPYIPDGKTAVLLKPAGEMLYMVMTVGSDGSIAEDEQGEALSMVRASAKAQSYVLKNWETTVFIPLRHR